MAQYLPIFMLLVLALIFVGLEPVRVPTAGTAPPLVAEVGTLRVRHRAGS